MTEQAGKGPAPSGPPARFPGRAGMSLEVAVDLLACGGLLAGLCLLARCLEPGFPGVTLFAGLVGGALSVLWGVLGWRTGCCRMGAIVTLAVEGGVLAAQAVKSWGPSVEDASNGRMVSSLMAVLVVCCASMLVNLIRNKAGRPS
jgi:hypothetical protein